MVILNHTVAILEPTLVMLCYTIKILGQTVLNLGHTGAILCTNHSVLTNYLQPICRGRENIILSAPVGKEFVTEKNVYEYKRCPTNIATLANE